MTTPTPDWTPEQLAEAKEWMTALRKLLTLINERRQREQEPFDSLIEEVVHLTMTNALVTASSKLVDLAEENLGISLAEPEQLAEVIELFDGNRRKARL